MKRFTKCWGAALCVLSNNALASDPSALIPLLLGILIVVTLIAVGVSWAISLFFNGAIRLFIRWLPAVVLWVPVPAGADQILIYPAAFALFSYRYLTGRDILLILMAEIIAICVLFAICWRVNRNRPTR